MPGRRRSRGRSDPRGCGSSSPSSHPAVTSTPPSRTALPFHASNRQPKPPGGRADLLPTISRRPKRADAQRNYDKLLAAARTAFIEADAETSLEDIARRAGVGIGTRYRHLLARRVLMRRTWTRSAHCLARRADLPPWEALNAWLRRFVEYVATKQAVANELFAEGASSDMFASRRSALYAAGGPLLERAQQAGVVRSDVDITDLLHLVSGIAKVATPDRSQVERILDVALDGLRRASQ
jgi:AcrR family transcriptional regulator